MADDRQVVFHLATPDDWAAAVADGRVTPPSLALEGFIHCSTAAQVPATIQRHFPEADELRLLQLDLALVGAELRWEQGRPGEEFPHLYRALEVAEIARVVTWRRGDDWPGPAADGS